MKNLFRTITLSLVLFFTLVTLSSASSYTFTPPDHDMHDLAHGYYYTWGLDWEVPQGETIVGASLFFDDIRDWTTNDPNVLYVHLFDAATVGITSDSDENNTDDFSGQDLKLFQWNNLSATAQDLTYVFSPTDLVTLTTYLGDGNFGFGFDPDCHFYNNGITFTVETAAVPIPGTLWLLGSGLLGILGIRRKQN